MTEETVEQPHAPRRRIFRMPAGWSRPSHLPTNATVLVSALLLAGSLWLASANLDEVRKTDTLGAQTYGSGMLAEKVLSTLTDAQTGQRGYLLTGNPGYLAPFEAARARLPTELARLRAQPQISGQDRRLDEIRALSAAEMSELDSTIALAKAGQLEAALNIVRTNRGDRIMEALRIELDGLSPGVGPELRRDRSLARSAWPRIAMVALGVLASGVLATWGLGQRKARRAVSATLASLRQFTSAFGLSQGLLRTIGGTITFWAGGMERLYGYTAGEAIGRRSDELLGTTSSTPQPQIQAALEREGHWEGEVVNRHRDGSTLEVATQLTLHQGAPGESDAVIELDNDVSETRRAQRADEQSSALLRAVVETAAGRIYAKDLGGRMLLANGGALRLFGKPWSEVEGRTDLELLANPAEAEIVMANDRRIMAAGHVENLEELIGDENGAAQVWLSTKTPLRNAAGEIRGLVGVSVDITEVRRRASQLAVLNLELTHALADRTAALQQRDILLREVYHRVKNNLQVIDGLIVMQARQMDDPGATAALLDLRNRLHALALVHHQLMHSKNLKTFDIAPFLQELAGKMVEGAVVDGIHLSIRAMPLEVDLDFAIPLGLLMAELVTNSLKHAFPNGKGTISVTLERATDGKIVLIVADDGQGRRSDIAAPGSRRPGLGTTIINGLVNQLQGEQILDSESGARTEIRVAAPAVS